MSDYGISCFLAGVFVGAVAVGFIAILTALVSA